MGPNEALRGVQNRKGASTNIRCIACWAALGSTEPAPHLQQPAGRVESPRRRHRRQHRPRRARPAAGVQADAHVAGARHLGGGRGAGKVVEEEAEPVHCAPDLQVALLDSAGPRMFQILSTRGGEYFCGAARSFLTVSGEYAAQPIMRGNFSRCRRNISPAHVFRRVQACQARVGSVHEEAGAAGRAGLEGLAPVAAVLGRGPELLREGGVGLFARVALGGNAARRG